MTISKKLTATVLAGIMSVGMAFSAFASLPTDVVDSPYEESIETLGALEIMIGDGNGQFRPNDSIRRSEFAKVAVEALGMGSIAQSSNHKTIFPDVVENHWANGYINVAVAQDIIIGDDQGNFRPDDPISYSEAMAILVRSVGHEPAALAKGGYPNGYISVGSQIGIAKKAVTGHNSAVTRGMIAQMTFMNADTLAAFGDKEIQIYSGAEKPELKNTLPVEKEIKSIFYNDTYFGLIFNNEDEENSRHLEVYDKHCKNVMEHDFQMDYEKVSFLKDHEICLQNDYECALIGINGVDRFTTQFDVPVIKIVEEYFGLYYTFVLEGKTQKVRLI